MDNEEIRNHLVEITNSSSLEFSVTYENLDHCITAFIKETLRHTSPTPFNLRILEESKDKYKWSSGTWFFGSNMDRFLSEEHGGTGEVKINKS
ncbi:hypothetical protein C2G38_2243902 [Gigaspora rosea]|uniref:Uncharacterized protein n=1 Tax=Gigaspora rosea TaxID=44941 RepID=A0A397VJH7_9GLOM|nr:hypothetical protein C2G38_2243902 [Gigaspora rosea]